MYFQLQAQLDKKDANGIRSENVDEKTEDETEQDNGYRGASYAAVLVSLPHSLPSESKEVGEWRCLWWVEHINGAAGYFIVYCRWFETFVNQTALLKVHTLLQCRRLSFNKTWLQLTSYSKVNKTESFKIITPRELNQFGVKWN